MVGLGWESKEGWTYETFIAQAENLDQEQRALENFVGFLQNKVGDALTDKTKTSIYHWTNAEVWQSARACDRHQFPDNHPLRRLPWYDLQQVFHRGPIGIPDAWGYRLKDVAKALGKLDPDLDPGWPGDLDQGLSAMVMGWRAYENPHPQASKEMEILKQYLEADCHALCQIMQWLRSASA